MSDKEQILDELRKGNAEFLQHNPAAPQLVPQFRDIYIVRLLEFLIGPAVIDLQIDHERWIAEQVGNIQIAARKASLVAPGDHTVGGKRLNVPMHQGRVTR